MARPILGLDADANASRLNGVVVQYTAIWSVSGTLQTRDANFGNADGSSSFLVSCRRLVLDGSCRKLKLASGAVAATIDKKRWLVMPAAGDQRKAG